MIDYTDSIYPTLAPTIMWRPEATDKIKEIRTRAIRAGPLVDCPIRHMGTERAQIIYSAIQRYLTDNGVEILRTQLHQFV